MADSNKKNVYILYNFVDGKQTDTQKSTRKLVEKLREKYKDRCCIKRYWVDFIPGRNILDEHSRFLTWSHFSFTIVTRESMASNLFSFESRTSLFHSIENYERFVFIGVGIEKNDVPLQIQTLKPKLYTSFSQIDVNNDTFLDAAFLSPSSGEATSSSLPQERAEEDKRDCSSLPETSSWEMTSSSLPQERTGEEGYCSSFPEKCAEEDKGDCSSLLKTSSAEVTSSSLLQERTEEDKRDCSSLPEKRAGEEGDCSSFPEKRTEEDKRDCSSLPEKPAGEERDCSSWPQRFGRLAMDFFKSNHGKWLLLTVGGTVLLKIVVNYCSIENVRIVKAVLKQYISSEIIDIIE